MTEIHKSSPESRPRSHFGLGFWAPFRGLGLWLRRASLLRLGLPSLGIGLALTAVIGLVWFSQFDGLHTWLAGQSVGAEGNALRVALWAVRPTLILGGLGLGVFLLVALGSLFASPWQWRLARRTEELLGEDASLQPAEALPASQAILAGLGRLGWLLGWLLLGFFLYLVPWFGALLYAGWIFCVLVLYLASLFTGPALAARGLTRWSRLRFAWRHRLAMLGFGLGLILLALIPLVQAACLPASAVGAVELVRRLRAGE